MRMRRAFILALVVALVVGLAWPASKAVDVATETPALIPADQVSDTTPGPFLGFILAEAVAVRIASPPLGHPLLQPLPRSRHPVFLDTARAPPRA